MFDGVKPEAMEDFQKLTLFEEDVIESYPNALYGWGWLVKSIRLSEWLWGI